MFNEKRGLPFYMSYQQPVLQKEEDVLRDLDYLQQLYPKEVRTYQKRIMEALDKIEYKGSMIYDEYPDKFLVYKLGKDILAAIKREEAKEEQEEQEEKWQWVGIIIQVLLSNEIYRRRHSKPQPRFYYL